MREVRFCEEVHLIFLYLPLPMAPLGLIHFGLRFGELSAVGDEAGGEEGFATLNAGAAAATVFFAALVAGIG